MPRSVTYTLVFAPEVVDHLSTIERRAHAHIQAAIDEQLSHTPAKKTKNRKFLEQPAPYGATWELRFGPANRFRVFYEIDEGKQVVHILAIGVKERNRLIIGREEYGR